MAPEQPEPLCSHCGFPLPKHGGGLRHYGTHTAHQENECLRLLQAEIERLTAALAKANNQAEHFEREWYLRGDEIERLRKDAMRYQWLRDPNNGRAVEVVASYGLDDAEELDAAIDAAMKERP